jgi:hypothetical protein
VLSFLGDLIVGETLLARPNGVTDADGIDRSSGSFQWLRNDSPISGATSSSYVLTSADQCKQIKLRWTFRDNKGNSETVFSRSKTALPASAIDPRSEDTYRNNSIFRNPGDSVSGNTRPRGTYSILGDAEVGKRLTARPNGITDADGINSGTVSFKWFRNDQVIAGASGETYTITAADNYKHIRGQYIFTDNKGTREVLTSSSKFVAPPVSNICN